MDTMRAAHAAAQDTKPKSRLVIFLGLVRTPAARHPRLNAWLVWWSHVGVTLLIAGFLGGVVLPHLHGAWELAIYRARAHEVGEAIRAMQARARTQRHSLVLSADAKRRAFQVAGVYERPTRFERIEEMIWLPRGLEIAEAPTLTANPFTGIAPNTIVLSAPAYNRLFRVMLLPGGRVEVHEEPTL